MKDEEGEKVGNSEERTQERVGGKIRVERNESRVRRGKILNREARVESGGKRKRAEERTNNQEEVARRGWTEDSLTEERAQKRGAMEDERGEKIENREWRVQEIVVR